MEIYNGKIPFNAEFLHVISCNAKIVYEQGSVNTENGETKINIDEGEIRTGLNPEHITIF